MPNNNFTIWHCNSYFNKKKVFGGFEFFPHISEQQYYTIAIWRLGIGNGGNMGGQQNIRYVLNYIAALFEYFELEFF